MTAPFAIAIDVERGLLRVVARGFWTTETVAAFVTALRPFVAGLRETHDRYDIIADARDFPVQSGPVGEAFSSW